MIKSTVNLIACYVTGQKGRLQPLGHTPLMQLGGIGGASEALQEVHYYIVQKYITFQSSHIAAIYVHFLLVL